MVAKTQRWKPEEFLRTLVEAEIASRDASNARGRMKAAAFPVTKTLDEFDVAASSVPQATFDYLASLEWIAAKENLCLVGPAGTGKSHLLVALGHHAIEVGRRVRYFTATELVETLYRGLADNSVGRVIEQILKADLILIDEIGFAPMDDTGAQLFFRIVAAAYERRSLGIGSHWPFEDWGRFLPEHTTAVSLLDRLLHHSVVVATSGESFRLKEARQRGGAPSSPRVEHHREGCGHLVAKTADWKLATDTRSIGSDALTPLSWLGSETKRVRLGTAACQLSARTPTAMAMAALTPTTCPEDASCSALACRDRKSSRDGTASRSKHRWRALPSMSKFCAG